MNRSMIFFLTYNLNLANNNVLADGWSFKQTLFNIFFNIFSPFAVLLVFHELIKGLRSRSRPAPLQ